jgi:hypothetical protein
MHKDMARLETQRQELSDRITSLQASIFKGSEKLDQVQNSAGLLMGQTGDNSRMLAALVQLHQGSSVGKQLVCCMLALCDPKQSMHTLRVCPAAVQVADELEPGGVGPVVPSAAAKGGRQPGPGQIQVNSKASWPQYTSSHNRQLLQSQL